MGYHALIIVILDFCYFSRTCIFIVNYIHVMILVTFSRIRRLGIVRFCILYTLHNITINNLALKQKSIPGTDAYTFTK